MKNDDVIYRALLSMLDEGVPVNKHSLCKRAGIHRYSLDYRIKKLKGEI